MGHDILRDLRLGIRVLVKDRSFSALAVIVLALGIAGVTTMFSVVTPASCCAAFRFRTPAGW